MKFSEIEKIATSIRRELGKKFGYKQSDYINWKIKDGYFFCLDTLHVIHTELNVKPIFIDDLYWRIIYPNAKKKLPDSLRGNGSLSHLCEKIWEERFPEKLKKDFSAEEYEQIFTNVYQTADKEIDKFLQKYPDPNMFDELLSEKAYLSKTLIQINQGNFQNAIKLAEKGLNYERGVHISYRMPDGNEKNEFEFILDYCRTQESVR